MQEVLHLMQPKLRDFEAVLAGVQAVRRACEADGFLEEARQLGGVVELLRLAHPFYLPGLFALVHEDPAAPERATSEALASEDAERARPLRLCSDAGS